MIAPTERRNIECDCRVEHNKEIKRKRILWLLNHMPILILFFTIKIHILESFKERDEQGTEQVREELLNHEDSVLAQWVYYLHPKLRRDGLKRTD